MRCLYTFMGYRRKKSYHKCFSCLVILRRKILAIFSSPLFFFIGRFSFTLSVTLRVPPLPKGEASGLALPLGELSNAVRLRGLGSPFGRAVERSETERATYVSESLYQSAHIRYGNPCQYPGLRTAKPPNQEPSKMQTSQRHRRFPPAHNVENHPIQ